MHETLGKGGRHSRFDWVFLNVGFPKVLWCWGLTKLFSFIKIALHLVKIDELDYSEMQYCKFMFLVPFHFYAFIHSYVFKFDRISTVIKHPEMHISAFKLQLNSC